MSPRSLLRSVVLATLAALLLVAPKPAGAQGLIDFLWGGSAEWGGGRQTVGFDSKYTPNQIIVSFGDRRLYLITRKGSAISYPIAVPREQSRWQGATTVSEKRIKPSWRPTPEMMRENPKLPTWVPGGHPMNPLGVRAMYLGASTYRIHGTDAPWTIGQAVSKGCIRMYNEDVLDLYPRVPVGMKVTVTWQQFHAQSVAANTDSGPLFGMAPPAFEPPAYKSPPRARTIRNLPPPPAGNATDALSAENAMPPPAPATDDKPAKPVASKATAPKAKTAAAPATPSPATTATTATAPAKAVTTASPLSAVEAAQKAAEAATRAAEAARRAAEAAKKAAADARKATSPDSDKEPDKATAKSAAL